MAQQSLVFVIEALRSHPLRHTIQGWSLWRAISPIQRLLYLTIQDTPNRHNDPGGIRTRNPIKRAAADPRLTPRGHWDPSARLRAEFFLVTLSDCCVENTTTSITIPVRLSVPFVQLDGHCTLLS
jgi:hypothetical protein